MTTFTMRHIKGHFVVTGPDVPPTQFKSRAEARDGCKAHYPGSPVHEVGEGARNGQLDRRRRDREPTHHPRLEYTAATPARRHGTQPRFTAGLFLYRLLTIREQ